jgi:hypothetical protein
MIALILAALIQTQETSVESRIDAFIKGDPAARAELAKLGAAAIRALQKARDRGPEKIDALVYELKKAAAFPKCDLVIADLEKTKSIDTIEVSVESALLQIVQGIVGAAFVDKLDMSLLKSRTFRLQHRAPVSVRAILDDLCGQTGLDYGMFHNHLVLGHPHRLWPSGPPEKPRALTAEETARAKALVEQLADELIEVREAATRDLKAMGPPVLPVLKGGLSSTEADLVARCRALIWQLEYRPRGAFGPPPADRQDLPPDDEKLLNQIRSIKVSLDFQNTTLTDAAAYLKEFAGVKLEVNDRENTKSSFRIRAGTVFDALCLMTQARGLDFMIQDGKVLIDSGPALELRVPGRK